MNEENPNEMSTTDPNKNFGTNNKVFAPPTDGQGVNAPRLIDPPQQKPDPSPLIDTENQFAPKPEVDIRPVYAQDSTADSTKPQASPESDSARVVVRIFAIISMIYLALPSFLLVPLTFGLDSADGLSGSIEFAGISVVLLFFASVGVFSFQKFGRLLWMGASAILAVLWFAFSVCPFPMSGPYLPLVFYLSGWIILNLPDVRAQFK